MSNRHTELTKRPHGGAIDIDVLKRRSWPGITAQYLRISAPAIYDFKIPTSSNLLALLDLYRTEGETVAPGFSPSFTKNLRNKMIFKPSGSELDGWCKIDKPGTITSVTINQTAPNGPSIDLVQIPARIEFEDEMLRSVLLRFQAILNNPSLDTPGYVDTLVELLKHELNRVASRRPHEPVKQSGLTARQVHIVVDYMDSHLADKMAISEFAALLNMTPFHFIRTFKQATGVPPHQFMIRRRIDRAKELLAERHTAIADVAAKSGFNSAAELTRAFRRIVGTTPSSYRRDVS
jgi:AraC family transcriptional regulator